MGVESRSAMVVWNILICLTSWGLFGYRTSDLLAAVIIAIVLIALSGLFVWMMIQSQRLTETREGCSDLDTEATRLKRRRGPQRPRK